MPQQILRHWYREIFDSNFHCSLNTAEVPNSMKTKTMQRITDAQAYYEGAYARQKVTQAVDDALCWLEDNKQSFSARGELMDTPWRPETLRPTTNPTLLLHRYNTLQGRVFEFGLFFIYQALLDGGFFRKLEQQSFFGATSKGEPVAAWDTIVHYVSNPTTSIVVGELMAMREDARDRTGEQVAAESASMTLRKLVDLHKQSINTSPAKVRDNQLAKGYAPLGLVRAWQGGPHDEFAIKPGLVSILFHEQVFVPMVTKWEPTLAGTLNRAA